MKTKLFFAGLFFALSTLFAFSYSSVSSPDDEAPTPCPCDDIIVDIDLPNANCTTPQFLRLIYCDATINWLDLNSLPNPSSDPWPVPCRTTDCGSSCPLGIDLSGFGVTGPVPIPAPGGSAHYYAAGGCLCPGQTLEIFVDNSGPQTVLRIRCI